MPAEAAPNLTTLSTQALQELLNNLASAKQFAIEQAPDVCQQFVTWGILSNLFIACVLLVLSVVVYIPTVNGVRGLIKNEINEGIAFLVICGVGSTPFLFGFSMAHFYHAALPYFAPKVYLLQTIAQLIRGF